MIRLKIISRVLFFLFVLAMFSCSGGQQNNKRETGTKLVENQEKSKINQETQLLLDKFVEMGDYANSRDIPSLMDASSVYEELNGNNLILDIRNPEIFINGHIKGAKNVQFRDLYNYFNNDINPTDYNKIVIVCYAGQGSSYATALLRLAGYNNVYAMRWGMSGWNKDFAEGSWLDVTSSKYESKLESTDNEKAPTGDFPLLSTGKSTGAEILTTRLDSVFAQGYSAALIYADEIFEAHENFYIVNYDRRDKYESGHIPGAIRYKPGGTLGIVAEMRTIPASEQVVFYCNTGHNSAFATAFLRLFGYDAKTLIYGNNAFMYDKMVKEEDSLSWIPFTESVIEDYPYVED